MTEQQQQQQLLASLETAFKSAAYELLSHAYMVRKSVFKTYMRDTKAADWGPMLSKWVAGTPAPYTQDDMYVLACHWLERGTATLDLLDRECRLQLYSGWLSDVKWMARGCK